MAVHVLDLDRSVAHLKSLSKDDQGRLIGPLPTVSSLWVDGELALSDDCKFLCYPNLNGFHLYYSVITDNTDSAVLGVKCLKSGTHIKADIERLDSEQSTGRAKRLTAHLEGSFVYVCYKEMDKAGFRVTSASLTLYKLNLEKKALDQITTHSIKVSPEVVSLLPAHKDPRMKHLESDRFISDGSRLFSMMFVASHNCAFFIYCYYRNSFVPVGRGNTGIKGFWKLEPGVSVIFEGDKTTTRGVFSFQRIPQAKFGEHQFIIRRLYIRI
jgi:hypothetical protein